MWKRYVRIWNGISEGCGTQEGKCGCCHETSKEEMMFNMMLEIADSAWMKLMKEKMMKHYEKTKGHEMEKMAQMMADANSTRWMNEEEFMKMKPGMLEMMKRKWRKIRQRSKLLFLYFLFLFYNFSFIFERI